MGNEPPERISELDLSRIGVISVLRNLPITATEWEEEFQIGSIEYRVKGRAALGRPHGIDADVLLAVQTLFFWAGCPDNGLVETTPYGLLKLSGHGTNGEMYARLKESLLRTEGVRWTHSRYEWNTARSQAKIETSITGLFSQVDMREALRTSVGTQELDPEATLRIYLTPAFASSIRAGAYQLLDAEMLERLGQPGARSLYRVLQAHRVQLDGSLAGELSVTLSDWLSACGITGRIDSAKDTLHRAHERMIQNGYLRDVAWAGRGMKTRLTYYFHRTHADPELVALLLEQGVTRPVAEALVTDHPDRIRPAVEAVKARMSNGYVPRSRAAVMVDAVRRPDRYIEEKKPVLVSTAAGTRAGSAPRRKAAVLGQQLPLLTVPEQPADRREALISAFKMLFRRDLTADEREGLSALSEEGMTALSSALMGRKKDLVLAMLGGLGPLD
ncbi:replication initiator protein A [Deinococcus hopiensis]|uniref:Plasmid replication initiator protein n=1 Tax=Deinococcus hopiensis KR-140 TaxID=695939 RepID=A0A1W1UPM6_9DEIO|nr:replication initiator protein A [Deinococcus hopiensis]SMB83020.1 Plasmid replication initiator protein [Deinococcus hopiensis KR-140]